MNAFTYIVTEGVHDVAFLGRLLTLAHEASRINKLEDLDEALRGWLGTFKWPSLTGKHHDIARMAVPAPAFYRLATGRDRRAAQRAGDHRDRQDADCR